MTENRVNSLEVNSRIAGTTLVVVSPVNSGKVVCQCSVCGMKDVYSASYLKDNAQECRNCARLKTLKDDKLGDYSRLAVISKRTELWRRDGINAVDKDDECIVDESPFKFIKKGDKVGDLVAVGFIGKFNRFYQLQTPTKVALQCPMCKFTKIMPLRQNQKTIKPVECPNCHKEIRESQKEVNKALQKYEEHVIKIQSKRNEKKGIQGFPFKASLLGSKLNTKATSIKSTLEEKNPKCYVASMKVENGIYVSTLVCKKCGSEIVVSSTNRGKELECPGCKKLEKNENYRGPYMLDRRGAVYNGIEVTDQYIDKNGANKCSAQCVRCKREFHDLDMYKMLHREYYCDCNKANALITCDNIDCNYSFEVPVADLVRGKSVYCPKCNREIDGNIARLDMQNSDSRMTLIRRLKNAGEQLGRVETVDTVSGNSSLIKEKEPLYISTEGERYFRCSCVNCNKSILLSETDIPNYEHENCGDVREVTLKSLDADNIKLEEK